MTGSVIKRRKTSADFPMSEQNRKDSGTYISMKYSWEKYYGLGKYFKDRENFMT